MNRIVERYRASADPLRSERRAELVLVVLGALLLLQVFWSAFRVLVPASLEPVAPTPASMQVAPVEQGAGVAPDQRDEIRRRPLFWAGRVPLQPAPDELAPAQPAAQQASANSLKGVKLAGIFGAGEEAGIIVISQGKKRRLVVGQELDGWTLAQVEPAGAVLNQNGKQSRLELVRVAPAASRSTENRADTRGSAGKNKKNASKKNTSDKQEATAAPPRPEGLGLGGGDRNRG